MAFGANCSCFFRYQLVLRQARLNLSHHITKLQEVLVRSFLRGKFYHEYFVQWAGLFLRHSEYFSSTFFLVVLYSINLKAEESRSVCCLPAFPHTHLFYKCSVTNQRFLRMQFSRYWNTLRYFSVSFCSLFLIILSAELLIKLTDEQIECFHLRGGGKRKFLVHKCTWDDFSPCVDFFVVTGTEFHQSLYLPLTCYC